jgi:hypothetical protein
MLEYRLSNKSLQLAVLYVDRFLSLCVGTPKSALQLLGVAALLIASKFEDVRPVELASLVWISDEAYSPTAIKDMEKVFLESVCCFVFKWVKQGLLEALNWDVACVPAVCWLDGLVSDVGLEPVDAVQLLQLSTYLSHLVLQHWPAVQGLLPSQQACAAVYYAGLAQVTLEL